MLIYIWKKYVNLLQNLTHTQGETAGLKPKVFESQENVHAPSAHCKE
jgi:hypothetical protein